jgi:alpha-L-fucosidase 2
MKVARTALAAILISATLAAQGQTVPVAKLVAEPARLVLTTGEAVPFKVTAYDAAGKPIPDAVVRINFPRRSAVLADGKVTAFTAGTFTATAVAPGPMGAPPVTIEIPVTVSWPPVASIEVIPEPGRLYSGVTLGHRIIAKHADGSTRTGATATWRVSDATIASVDRFGFVTATRPGTVTVTAEIDGAKAEKTYTVTASPVASIDLSIKEDTIRTGDVIRLQGVAKRADGAPVPDAPITWTYTYRAPEGNQTPKAPGGAGIIDEGLFVATRRATCASGSR